MVSAITATITNLVSDWAETAYLICSKLIIKQGLIKSSEGPEDAEIEAKIQHIGVPPSTILDDEGHLKVKTSSTKVTDAYRRAIPLPILHPAERRIKKPKRLSRLPHSCDGHRQTIVVPPKVRRTDDARLQRDAYELQRAQCLENAIRLRQRHWAKKPEEIAKAARIDRDAAVMRKYIELSFKMGYPIPFGDWLVALPETVTFEKIEVKPLMESMPEPAAVYSIHLLAETLADTSLVKLFTSLDYPSMNNLRLSCRRLNSVYEKNKVKVTETILAKTKDVSLVPGLRLPTEGTAEYKLRRQYHATDWIVQTILSHYHKFRETHDRKLAAHVHASSLNLYRSYHGATQSKHNIPPPFLRGKTYPFPGLMRYHLEKSLDSLSLRKRDTLIAESKMTMLERMVLSDPQETDDSLEWTLGLILNYLKYNRMVYFSIGEYVCNDEDEDIDVEDEDYYSFIKSLSHAELWELLRLLEIEEDDPLCSSKKKANRKVPSRRLSNSYAKFIRNRVQEILGGRRREF